MFLNRQQVSKNLKDVVHDNIDSSYGDIDKIIRRTSKCLRVVV